MKMKIISSVGYMPNSMVFANLNDDKYIDVITTNSDNSISILLSYDNGSFTWEKRFSTSNNPINVAVIDFNIDNIIDLIILTDNRFIHIFAGYNNGNFKNDNVFF